jgi:hypothetical protein
VKIRTTKKMAKTFIPAVQGNRKMKIFPDDFIRLYKISKRKTPTIPKFEEKPHRVMETDVDS